MKKKFFITTLFSHSFLQASEFGTLFMSATLFILLITLVITLTTYIKKLQKENIKNSALFMHSNVPTLFINTKGRIADLNESAITLLGYSKKQLSTRQWYEKLLPDERSVQIRHQIRQELKTDSSSTFNAHLIRADGKLLKIDYTISRLPQPLNGSILTLIDISRYREG